MNKTASDDSQFRNPPTTTIGILKQLGPGLIVAGSIVGSGELIATTAVGAEAGFTLMWLIIVGCMIKVFAQVEFGRYTLIHGRTTLDGLNEVPGPRFRVNWIVWYWLIMFLVSLAQLGGIVGGVGQAVTISVPMTESGRQRNQYQELMIEKSVTESLITQHRLDFGDGDSEVVSRLRERFDLLDTLIEEIESPYRSSAEYQQAAVGLNQAIASQIAINNSQDISLTQKRQVAERLLRAEKLE